MTPKEAEQEMVDGFSDGYDRDCPEPSHNRSHSYRHGFANGRDDIGLGRDPKNPRANAYVLREMAAAAIAEDCTI